MVLTEPTENARVFISCGQYKGSGEVEIAEKIAGRLRELGFVPYVAVNEQTLLGLKENIFARMRDSEYFVFVDFKRELLAESNPPAHRGSLFSHQELAIASFLGIEVLAFQERGVKTEDGIIRFLQANAIAFSGEDRHLLPNIIADKVQARGWDARWRGELVLERATKPFTDAQIRNLDNTLGRFFHLTVRNRHRDRTATNCYAYLEKAVRLGPVTELPVRAIEFKWAGYVLPSVHIPPGNARDFDALHILHRDPTVLQFNAFTDSTEFIPHVAGAGRYELHYLVMADNFPPARRSFKLNLSSSLNATTFD